MSDSDALPTLTTSNARIYDLHVLEEFAPEKRVRKKLFKTGQLWSEMVCYEPGQSTVMHHHPYEEEQFVVISGTATMNVGGDEITVTAGSVMLVGAKVPHDVRNLTSERLLMMFTKVPTRLAKQALEQQADAVQPAAN
jgi:mannose-6-phosphate isomerase-like protein (cupin superfamily)